METSDLIQLHFVVIFMILGIGLVAGVHRNTADVTRSSGTSVRQIKAVNPATFRQTSGISQQSNIIDPPQHNSKGFDFVPRERSPLSRHHFSPSRSFGFENSQSTRSGSVGHNSPFQTIQRQRNALPYTNHRGGSVDLSSPEPEPVGEPPVTFLNRERMRRRNRMSTDRTRLNNPPQDVQASTFKEQPNPFQGGQIPFSGGRTEQSVPPSIYDNRLPLVNGLPNIPPTFSHSMHQHSRHPDMASFPGVDGPSSSEFPLDRPPLSPAHGQQDYEHIMSTVDRMLDTLPIHMRRMLIRRRRMRRMNRLRNFWMMQGHRLRGTGFVPMP